MPTPPPGAIEAATTGLLAFVAGACQGPVHVGVPADADEAALWLWPYELVSEQQTNGAGARLPYRFAVRYLVAGTGVAALGLLDQVLAASVRAGQPQLLLDAPPAELWRSLSLAPRPVLGFHVPCSIAYPVGTPTLVRGSLQVKPLDLAPLTGSVLGTGDVPVAGARVEVAGTGLATHTGAHGQFRFAAVPDGGPLVLTIYARGRTFTARVDAPAGQPVTVHCDFTATTDPTVHATADNG